MPRSLRPTQRPRAGQRALAAWLAGTIFVLGLLAVAPSWHARLHHDDHDHHHDAHSRDHSCVITLFAGGVDAAATPPPALAPATFRVELVLTPDTVPLFADAVRLLPPGRAPPARA